jgi:hypothetical protein
MKFTVIAEAFISREIDAEDSRAALAVFSGWQKRHPNLRVKGADLVIVLEGVKVFGMNGREVATKLVHADRFKSRHRPATAANLADSAEIACIEAPRRNELDAAAESPATSGNGPEAKNGDGG